MASRQRPRAGRSFPRAWLGSFASLASLGSLPFTGSERAMRRRMMDRVHWWHEAGALLLCPTEAQLLAALTPWSPRRLLRQGRSDALPWRGLMLPAPALLAALRSDVDPGPGWVVQLLLPERDLGKGTVGSTLDAWLDPASDALPPHLADLARAARSPGAPALTRGPDLRTFLHRCAQLPHADLPWAASRDVLLPDPGRAWPPADDHFPVEVHGHRAVRAARGLAPHLHPTPRTP